MLNDGTVWKCVCVGYALLGMGAFALLFSVLLFEILSFSALAFQLLILLSQWLQNRLKQSKIRIKTT